MTKDNQDPGFESEPQAEPDQHQTSDALTAEDLSSPPEDDLLDTDTDASLDAPELAKALAEARAEAQSHHEALLRAHAELDNVRKRSQRELENAHKFGHNSVITELLPVRDSMELGLAACDEPGVDVAKVREGLELTLKMLAGALEKSGVAEINPIGESFDPELHQAMSMQEDPTAESGDVIMVVQKGYALNERLVRPATVIVAK